MNEGKVWAMNQCTIFQFESNLPRDAVWSTQIFSNFLNGLELTKVMMSGQAEFSGEAVPGSWSGGWGAVAISGGMDIAGAASISKHHTNARLATIMESEDSKLC